MYYTETDLSNFQKVTITIMRITFRKEEPKIIHSRGYKHFSDNAFREDLLLKHHLIAILRNLISHFSLTSIKALTKHAPVIGRFFRANQALF